MSDIAWAAGLFEGEGCISLSRRTRAGIEYTYPILVLAMSDKDVVDRFHAIVKHGQVYKTPQRGFGTRTMWRWQLFPRNKVEEVVLMFWDYMGERRQAKAIELGIEP